MQAALDRPLDTTWDDPLPHALTHTRTYLSPPSPHTHVAIIAVHGRGDNAADFCDAFVPHLRAFFGLADGPVDAEPAPPEQGQVSVSVRALDALDGIWFPSHKAHNETELAFASPYVHSSLLKLHEEMAFLQGRGVAASRIVLLGFSQGAILVNSYLIQALRSDLALPGKVLGWAGSRFTFDTPFPRKAWCYFRPPHDPPPARKPTAHVVESHQQCGTADPYFTQDEVEAVAAQTAREGADRVRVSVAMEPGNHSVLPGMVAKLIQMVQEVHSAHV